MQYDSFAKRTLKIKNTKIIKILKTLYQSQLSSRLSPKKAIKQKATPIIEATEMVLKNTTTKERNISPISLILLFKIKGNKKAAIAARSYFLFILSFRLFSAAISSA